MPELPEVSFFQQYFNQAALHRKVIDTQVFDDKIIRNVSAEQFIHVTVGRTFTRTYRRGKYLFVEMDNTHHILLHFGMSGDLKYYNADEERPRHERFRFLFENDMKLGFDCPRKFARIEYVPDLDAYIRGISLGIDALNLSQQDFLVLANGKKSTLKGFLLNQRLIAGIGNLYADEICYQAKIHPASRMHALSDTQLKTIWAAMSRILNEAVALLPHYHDYPEGWFWQKWRKEGLQLDKGTVARGKIAGRTTYWVEGWQVLYA